MRAEQKRRGPACAVALLPHAILILSLVGYALLGAALFHAIEGRSDGNGTREGYREFVKAVVETVRNNSAKPEDALLNDVGQDLEMILKDYKSVWSQKPERWHFYGSLFFCCTVFTTVGYGDIYPVTLTGKVACILYAMVGIPLMLLVISDVGDILAKLFFKSYRSLHSHCKRLFSHIWSPRKKPKEFATIRDGTYIFNRDVILQEDNRHMAIHLSIKQKAKQVLENVEMFDRIIAREKFECKWPLARSHSCPELDQMPPPPEDFKFWDFTSIGQEMDRFKVPFLVILLVVFAYILSCALILPLWEISFSTFDAFYFCFITLTTIGFGDVVPNHPKFFMLTFLFIIMGMAIMSMAFKLGQSRIVHCYHRFIRCFSCLGVGKVGKYDVQGE
ncbi:potassium channel subfamily K member 18 [Pygocentrus nattereri]|uniref:Potassium channel domain-containing protein n=1 Tax=Pygocentrus nattereri TaxID=42514 RepID=A0A3B4EF50_PYGNA|nr:potassium channel subfamily K member 18 [Pygocentrus nattereri]